MIGKSPKSLNYESVRFYSRGLRIGGEEECKSWRQIGLQNMINDIQSKDRLALGDK
jgi:hypothetical protein